MRHGLQASLDCQRSNNKRLRIVEAPRMSISLTSWYWNLQKNVQGKTLSHFLHHTLRWLLTSKGHADLKSMHLTTRQSELPASQVMPQWRIRTANGRHKRSRVWSLGENDPWRRKWQQAPVFLPGRFHGQGLVVGCRPQGQKELDTTEVA